MPNLRLLQLKADFKSGGYTLRDPAFIGMEKEFPVDYVVVHNLSEGPVGRLFQDGKALIEYHSFGGIGDVEFDYYCQQAYEIFMTRIRLVII